jgi:hypothetical protein
MPLEATIELKLDGIRQFPNFEKPIAAYRGFLRAIACRDLPATLLCMTEAYGRELRMMSVASDFSIFFDLWCQSYPKTVNIISRRVGMHTAVLETVGFTEGFRISSEVTLKRGGANWYVALEVFSSKSPGQNRCATIISDQCAPPKNQ